MKLAGKVPTLHTSTSRALASRWLGGQVRIAEPSTKQRCTAQHSTVCNNRACRGCLQMPLGKHEARLNWHMPSTSVKTQQTNTQKLSRQGTECIYSNKHTRQTTTNYHTHLPWQAVHGTKPIMKGATPWHAYFQHILALCRDVSEDNKWNMGPLGIHIIKSPHACSATTYT